MRKETRDLYHKMHREDCLDQVMIRLVHGQPLLSEHPISSSLDAVSLVGRYLIDMDREHLCVINLKTNCVPINFSVISIGTIDAACFTAREILKCSILSNAAAIILMHNHPSGKIEPSIDDRNSTQKLSDACKLMGIDFFDHVIVGTKPDAYYSIREERVKQWPIHRDPWTSVPKTVNMVADPKQMALWDLYPEMQD